MVFSGIITGPRISLRTVTLEDCTEVYLSWLENPEVNKYLETRWVKQSLDGIKSFVDDVRNSSHSFLFAIIIKDDYEKETHIGNIKIGPIHPHYSYADISYFIGNQEYWGQGLATEAIKMITEFAFMQLKLNRVQAGAFGLNIGSVKALTKAGYIKEGCLRKQLLSADNWDDHLLFGMLKEEFENKVQSL